MFTAIRNVVGVGLLVGLAAVTWLLGRPQPGNDPTAGSGEAADASYYLTNATLFGADAEGRIFYRLTAAEVRQPADGGALELRELKIDYDPSLDIRWQLSAAAGVRAADQNVLRLSDGVRLESTGPDDGPATSIVAASLTLDTRTSTASTEDRIALERGKTRFAATGLTADLVHDRIELHSDVSAHLVP